MAGLWLAGLGAMVNVCYGDVALGEWTTGFSQNVMDMHRDKKHQECEKSRGHGCESAGGGYWRGRRSHCGFSVVSKTQLRKVAFRETLSIGRDASFGAWLCVAA